MNSYKILIPLNHFQQSQVNSYEKKKKEKKSQMCHVSDRRWHVTAADTVDKSAAVS